METEDLILATAQAAVNACKANPEWIREALTGRRADQIDQVIDLFTRSNIPVLDAYPAAVPQTPTVVVLPASVTSMESFIGSVLGSTLVDNGDGTGQEVWDQGDMVEASCDVIVYSSSALLCRAVSQMLWWAIMIARQQVLEINPIVGSGLYELKVRLGPLDLSQEWGTLQNADIVYRRAVMVSWQEIFSHRTAFVGELARQIQVVVNDREVAHA